MENLTNISDTCRLCLKKEDANIHIFEGKGVAEGICMKIDTCLPVKVSQEDKLPKKICDECCYKVNFVHEFHNTCISSEKQLLEWIEHNKPITTQHEERIDSLADSEDIETSPEAFHNDASNELPVASTPSIQSNETDSSSKRKRKLNSNDLENEFENAPQKVGKFGTSGNDEVNDFSEIESTINNEVPGPSGVDAINETSNLQERNKFKEVLQTSHYYEKYKLKESFVFLGPLNKFNYKKHIFHKQVLAKLKAEIDPSNIVVEKRLKYRCNVCSEKFVSHNELSYHFMSVCQSNLGGDALDSDDIDSDNENVSDRDYAAYASSSDTSDEDILNKVNSPKSADINLEPSGLTEKDPKNTTKNSEIVLESSDLHEPLKYSCPICPKMSYGTLMKLYEHILTHDFTCFYCMVKCKTKDDLDKHMSNFHVAKPVITENITQNSVYITARANSVETQRIYKVKMLRCKLCSKIFKTQNDLMRHFNNAHLPASVTEKGNKLINKGFEKQDFGLDSVHSCKSCKMNFQSLEALERHNVERHANLNKYSCPVCGHMFLTEKLREQHCKSAHLQNLFVENVSESHETKVYVCTMCDDIFISKADLEAHSKYHTNANFDICKKQKVVEDKLGTQKTSNTPNVPVIQKSCANLPASINNSNSDSNVNELSSQSKNKKIMLLNQTPKSQYFKAHSSNTEMQSKSNVIVNTMSRNLSHILKTSLSTKEHEDKANKVQNENNLDKQVVSQETIEIVDDDDEPRSVVQNDTALDINELVPISTTSASKEDSLPVNVSVISEKEAKAPESVAEFRPKIFLKPLSELLEKPPKEFISQNKLYLNEKATDSTQTSVEIQSMQTNVVHSDKNSKTSETNSHNSTTEKLITNNDKKNKSLFKCHHCSLSMLNMSKLKRHMECFSCNICTYKTCKKSFLLEHNNEHSDVSNCILCKNIFPNNEKLEEHRQACHHCKHCTKDNIEDLKIHCKFKCTICSFKTCYLTFLKNHIQVHKVAKSNVKT